MSVTRDNEQKTSTVASRLVHLALDARASLGDVLDVGCGTGTVLAAARGRASTLSGVDVRPDLLDEARTHVPDARVAIASVDGERMTFADASFDTIFFCDVIEHLHSPYAALCEIARTLRPDGRLIVTTPNAASLVRKILRERWFGLQDPSHLYFFDAFTLGHLIAQSGFRIEASLTRGFTGNLTTDAALQALGSGGTLVIVARRT